MAVLLIVVFIGMCRIMFRSAFTYDEDRVAAVMALDEREVIRDRGLLVRSMVVLAAVMVGFVAHSALHIEPSMVALLGAGALVAVSKLVPADYLEEVEWPTLVFFMGLFIMVGALVEVGVIGQLGEQLTDAVDGTVLPSQHRAAVGLGRGVGHRGQHPLRRHRVAPRPGPRRERSGQSAASPGSVVGTRCRRRPRRQRHRRRSQRERRHHRHRRPQRSPDLVLDVHQVRLVVTVVTIAIAWPYLWLRYYA